MGCQYEDVVCYLSVRFSTFACGGVGNATVNRYRYLPDRSVTVSFTLVHLIDIISIPTSVNVVLRRSHRLKRNIISIFTIKYVVVFYHLLGCEYPDLPPP